MLTFYKRVRYGRRVSSGLREKVDREEGWETALAA